MNKLDLVRSKLEEIANLRIAVICGVTVDDIIDEIENKYIDKLKSITDVDHFVGVLYNKLLDLWDPYYVSDALEETFSQLEES